ncbi:hypothetical protein DFH07DRAFT_772179 [Mycena maculata]|uniref:Uncharacterized protein n=1 Tax=Mycena maculata TaxID=230809 RepID=A0AAD7NGK8_9AGAR|nr:hypothetical protein DFH07DRAFT_772177 [Mycena maculata]KAJ7759360.1 hypothetical protein DFH07DRAFT_772179 [Mycena maculata]
MCRQRRHGDGVVCQQRGHAGMVAHPRRHGVGRARDGQLCDVGFGWDGEGWIAAWCGLGCRAGSCGTLGSGGTVMRVAWGKQLRDTGPGRDECEHDGKYQAAVDPRRHMGVAPYVGFHGSIKALLGITCRSRPPSSQIRVKKSFSAVKKQVKSL